jgi:hypothetical protein
VAEHHPDRHTRYNTMPSEKRGARWRGLLPDQAFVRSLNGDAQAARTTRARSAGEPFAALPPSSRALKVATCSAPSFDP